MSTRWKQVRYQLEALACRVLEHGVPKLSRRACVGLGQILGALAYSVDIKGRAIGLANLEEALGGDYSAAERRKILRASYQNFVRTMVDLFWSSRITSENAHQLLQISGFEAVMERAAREKRGIVFVCCHQGNWEWSAVAFATLGGRANIVAEDFKNQLLTDLFVRLRSRDAHRIIPQDRSVLKLLRCVMRGEHTALLGDLNLDPSGAAVAITGFGTGPEGLEMCSTRLHAVLATRGNALLVPVLTEPLADGRCKVMAQPPIETTRETPERLVAQQTWDIFERSIRQRPEQWLWAYKHFRIRPMEAKRPYPFYARTDRNFEEMRSEPLTAS